MKKTLRYVGFALGGLAALVLVLLVLARFLISSEQVREAVLPLAKNALQRDVVLGDIDISLFSGIVLHDLTVMDKEGRTPFVEAGTVRLRYRFWPLLKLKVVVDEIGLEQPRLRVVRNADGSFNFSDLLQRKQTAGSQIQTSASETGEGRSFDLLVSEVLLSDGKVQFVDYQPNPDNPFTLELTEFKVRAENISATHVFPIEAEVAINQARLAASGQVDPSAKGGQLKIHLTDLNAPDFSAYYQKQKAVGLKALKINADLDVEGTVGQLHTAGRIVLDGLHLEPAATSGRTIRDLDISLDYDLELDRSAGVVDLKRGHLLVGGLPVDVQGRAEPFGGTPSVDGTLSLSRLDLATLPKLLPPALLGNVPALKPGGFVHGRFHLAGSLKDPKALLKTGEVRLESVQITAGNLRPEVTGTLTLAKDTLHGRQLNLVLGEDRALLDLKAANLLGKPIRINSDLAADRLQLDALLGSKAAVGGKKQQGSQPSAKTVQKQLGPFDLPVIAVGTLHVGQALWRGLLIEDLSARYQLKNNIFTLEQFSGKTAGGTFSETAHVDLSKPGLAYKTHIETSGIQSDSMFTALAPKMAGTVFGLLNLNVDLQGRGTGLEGLKQSLSGSGDLKVADGKITGAGLVSGLADFLDLEELRVLRFAQAAGQLEVKDGRVQVDGHLAGEQVRLRPTGSVGLDGTLDVGLPVRLAPALTARLDSQNKFSRFLTDSQGWGELPLKVTGTVKAPRFALDTAALSGSIRRGVQQQLQKTLEEKVFKSKQDASQEPDAGQPGEQKATETDETHKKSTEEKLLEGVMKGLFGK
ncbi:hypothetical protein Pcar_1313 [Syntrophotalea carbinolica DSM 2380]|uniref:AsmA domain-containing protein n=1 Tax=Syntrophotalea carbinolica (strain DSM 2380 / NBRC 103641 / GraBd1) TaxID=338963 RepID=Q3A4Z5_SYNC1|nr:AsmA family protein [Syntrophotalea carbinolica]ABA88562.1 hypothetical protein Pcar_1313 [Syntrophotalea carbinolica DSM 2380]